MSNKILRLKGAQVGIDLNTNNKLATLPLDLISISYNWIGNKNYFDMNNEAGKSHKGPAYLVGRAV